MGKMSGAEQMANIGSEGHRALNWRNKGNEELSRKASACAPELLDFSLNSTRLFSRLNEFARVREAPVDYFYGSNVFASSETQWRVYFDHSNYLARKDR